MTSIAEEQELEMDGKETSLEKDNQAPTVDGQRVTPGNEV